MLVIFSSGTFSEDNVRAAITIITLYVNLNKSLSHGLEDTPPSVK